MYVRNIWNENCIQTGLWWCGHFPYNVERALYFPTGGYVVQESYTAAVEPLQLQFHSIIESLKTTELNKNNYDLLTYKRGELLLGRA